MHSKFDKTLNKTMQNETKMADEEWMGGADASKNCDVAGSKVALLMLIAPSVNIHQNDHGEMCESTNWR